MGKKVSWSQAKDGVVDPYVDFNVIYSKDEWQLAYAFMRVKSPTDREAQFMTGSDDDIRIWLNGKEVLSANVPRGVGMDQDIATVTLKSGINDILVKVCNRYAGGWIFYLRITDKEGKPYDDLHSVPASDLYDIGR